MTWMIRILMLSMCTINITISDIIIAVVLITIIGNINIKQFHIYHQSEAQITR